MRISYIPKKHQSLLRDIRITNEGFLTSSGIAVRKPGGIVHIRPSVSVKSRSGKISIAHEFGHQVWDFYLTSSQRKLYRDEYSKIRATIPKHAPSYEVYSKLHGESPEESFAEIYGLYHGAKKERKYWKQKHPNLISLLERIT